MLTESLKQLLDGVYTLTMPPRVIGRGHRLLMLERLLAFFQAHDGVWFAMLGQVAAEWRAANPWLGVDGWHAVWELLPNPGACCRSPPWAAGLQSALSTGTSCQD